MIKTAIDRNQLDAAEVDTANRSLFLTNEYAEDLKDEVKIENI